MKCLRWIAWTLLLGASFSACEEPLVTVDQGELSFSADTVKFDSIFLNFRTPSERLLVTNHTDKNIRISRVWLESGDQSEFSLVVDGRRGDDVQDLVLASSDSLLVFVSLTSDLKDDFAEDYLAFQVGEQVQRILVRAFVVDAYLFKARLARDTVFGHVFTRDTVLGPDKPIIMDGPIIVAEGVTLGIAAGTELFFTPFKWELDNGDGTSTFVFFSTLIVQGTLSVEGTAEQPVIFQGTRLDQEYRENPSQWRGLRFAQTSTNNLIRHAVIKNGLIGVEVDSVSFERSPRVRILHTEIRNMAAFGLLCLGFSNDGLGLGPALYLENSMVYNANRTLAIVGGGNVEAYNCTFDNSFLFGRRQPQFFINNYAVIDQQGIVYPTRLKVVNSVIWGRGEPSQSEIELDSLAGGPFTSLNFDHSLLLYNPDNEVKINPYTTDCLFNLDPLFNDPENRDYRPREGSPLIDAGRDLSVRYLTDFRGSPDSLRTLPFDIGAWEYFPLE